MESWCRICSRSDEFRRFPLFSVADVCQEVIAKMITSCTDTQVSSEDGLPQQICPDCLITLSLAYSFRRLCRRTDAKFRETFDPRAPSHSAEHMATASGGGSQPRRSQSQVGDEAGGVVYDSVPVIKEEVEFYDYECSAPPPPEDQWVIQDPRTIHEGATAAMTVLHNAGPYQEDGGGGGGDGQPEVDDMMSSMVPMVTMEEGGGVGGHDPAEYGESSGAGQKKKRHEPERFSKRIRRQSEEFYEVEYTGEAKELEVLKTSRGKDLLALDGYMFYRNSQGTSRRERRKYTNKALTAALEAIYKHKITFREAEQTYAVPRATLNRAFKRYITMHGGSVVRSESPAMHDGRDSADPSHFLVAMPDPSGDGLLEEIITSDGQQLVLNPAKQLHRCEYCRKKMKKPFKHRNGKCMETKKVPARPRCPYCHIVFVRSSSIPLHVQNSCRVYRELCATSRELPDPNEPVDEPETEEVAPPPPPPVKVKNSSKTVDVKPILQKSKPKPSLICRYCYMSFGKRATLIKHQRDRCGVLNEQDVERLTSNLAALETSIAESAAADTTTTTTVPEPDPEPEKVVQDDEDTEETSCVYCTQLVSKKTRFQHHNGRCVIGRANADHPCPYCDSAYTSRSNLLRHQREHCQKYREEHNTDITLKNAFQGLPIEGDTSLDETGTKVADVSPSKPEKKPKLPPKEVVVKRTKPPKPEVTKTVRPRAPPEPPNFVCSYCRKGFAVRDTLIEHQRSCTARKLHKQVKCQFCGMISSNRGNLRKHQKVYCKKAPRENAPKIEKKEEDQETSPQPKKPKVVKPLKKCNIKKEKTSLGGSPVKVERSIKEDPLEQTPAKSSPTPSSDDEPIKRKRGRPGKHNMIPCPHCDKEFQNKIQLRNHTRVCIKSRKMYKCKYCPAEFTHPSNMSRHIRLKRCTAIDIVNESLENGFQSDNSNLLSSTVHEPEPEVHQTSPADEDFEMILPESSQEEQDIRQTLVENNNAAALQEVAADKVPDPVPVEVKEDAGVKEPIAQEEELVHPEAILYSEEVELQEQSSAVEVVVVHPEANALDTEQAEQ